jgi:hypothetical protein
MLDEHGTGFKKCGDRSTGGGSAGMVAERMVVEW